LKLKIIPLFILMSSSLLFPQFGKNKVQYEQFSWSYIQSSHFDIYYSEGSKALAEFTAVEAELAYQSIKETFEWPLQRRYAIILYNSHNAFQQTNVVGEYMVEGIGGVTELYKNRVVLPFEGSYEDLRHVIHHELVHSVMNDMYYGGSVQSLVSGAVRLRIPAWLAEGSCEFESVDWDVQTDMFMRDFAFQSRFIPIDYLSGYYAYKGGQSVFKYMNDRYGPEKITEFYRNLKSTHSVERSIQRSFNMDMEKFSEEWHKYLKKKYWPEINFAEDMNRVAVRLTDHDELKNTQNIAPAVSPSGSRLAFLSDRDGYADIYVMNSDDGEEAKRLVKGNRQANLEELKWLAPGISWSPDGRHVTFAAKSGEHDALVIVDTKKGKKKFLPIRELEGVYSAVWHPERDLIAFEGHDGVHSDIFVYDLKNKTLRNITNDPWRDSNPAWSPDGEHLIYASERMLSEIRDFRHPYQYDIFSAELSSGLQTQHTSTDWDENYPQFSSDRSKLLYTSDANGIHNIWVQEAQGSARAVTNILGGIFYLNLSRDDQTLYFSAFQNSGWDIYRLNNIFELPGLDLQQTGFRKEQLSTLTAAAEGDIESTEALTLQASVSDSSALNTLLPEAVPDSSLGSQLSDNSDAENANYRSYVFVPNYATGFMPRGALQDTIAIDSTRIMNEEGDYFDNPYKTKFSLDLVDSQLGYSTFYGFQGYSVFLFSDVFGDHQIGLSTELYIDLKNSDYSISYAYLKNRMNVGFNYFNYSDYYYSWLYDLNMLAVTQFRNYGGSLAASYPINRFYRLDFNETWYVAERSILNNPDVASLYNTKLDMFISSVAFVKDNVSWSYTAPMDGLRYRIGYDYVPATSNRNLSFNTLTLDLRKYWKLDMDYHIGLRINAGSSWGNTPQTFMVGGIDNWLNYSYNPNAPIFGGDGTGSFSDDMTLYYFSRFITPVRGVRYFEKSGHNFTVINAELRYPFIEYAKLRFPLPVNLYQVRGVLFTDVGTAWDDELTLWTNGGSFPLINSDYEDLLLSTGLGLRIYLGYFLLRIDTAWEYDGHDFSKPRYLFSLGGDF